MCQESAAKGQRTEGYKVGLLDKSRSQARRTRCSCVSVNLILSALFVLKILDLTKGSVQVQS